ncbi:MAG: class I SAM-dependent methyltransferase [Desulfarculaceae bacterium]|nr:class I SAM-dependent methyltransferase [Desulfarculaceae bacterium]MCF8048477.1 class I SAM-dependent methyltransferase [Desulfarculaceae bacterium]MCF8064417.1 class I SAM-dependent methyltransferase [Desulfarculaceae bacterium]MCF8098294.1 class I SAM-dependent methyltransferase [Desulfarculaceae bacterium]MCF8124124.1 class I SAM-dependent methyltransferase [Desulfarculaceae bacterium]
MAPEAPISPFRYMEMLINRAAVIKSGAREVLEVGPGSETMLAHLDQSTLGSVTIVDYVQDALDRARRRLKGLPVRTICCDVSLPGCPALAAESFDCVIANALVEHLEDDRGFIDKTRKLLKPGGLMLCTTVLGPGMYNQWDHAVGHYRRYSMASLRRLFEDFSQVQIIQSSLIQELVRPLFFHRLRKLKHGTLEENNLLFSGEHEEIGRPPYAKIYWALRFFLPVYLLLDWALKDLQGGIAVVVARR